jgi:hypothetical protein
MPCARACHLCLIIPAAFLIATGAAATDAPRACSVIEQNLAVGVTSGGTWSVHVGDGFVAELVLRGGNGGESSLRAGAAPIGLSFRQVPEPMPGTAGPFRTAFNLVTLEAGGTVLAETWVRFAGLPDAPRYSWTRLRCSAG